ncbi:hypothetical protein FRC03_005009 [Tulasnella sp. 419]|nr:hypothetical protein FRC03_005009 [Tulasnella sp. 419]
MGKRKTTAPEELRHAPKPQKPPFSRHISVMVLAENEEVLPHYCITPRKKDSKRVEWVIPGSRGVAYQVYVDKEPGFFGESNPNRVLQVQIFLDGASAPAHDIVMSHLTPKIIIFYNEKSEPESKRLEFYRKGEIRVLLYFVKLEDFGELEPSDWGNNFTVQAETTGDKKVSMDFISTSELGEDPNGPPWYCHHRPFQPSDCMPYMEHVFRYRSPDYLESTYRIPPGEKAPRQVKEESDGWETEDERRQPKSPLSKKRRQQMLAEGYPATRHSKKVRTEDIIKKEEEEEEEGAWERGATVETNDNSNDPDWTGD